MHTPQIPVDVSSWFGSGSTIMPSLPLDKPSRFSLDTAGVATLLGGDDAFSAMIAVHIYGNRRLLGLYNSPGAFHIAKRLYSFLKSASFQNVSNSKVSSKPLSVDATTLLELEDYKGPKYRAAHSGTVIPETGYLAALFMKECTSWDSEGKVVQGRRTQPVGITIADLGKGPASEMRPARSSASTLILASIPITVSVATCTLCAVCGDWNASLAIFVGIIANGLSSRYLGMADFVFAHPEPAKGSPAGDGILSSDKDIVLLKGTEGAVNSITRGKFSLRFANKNHFDRIRLCSVQFLIQGIIQLFLIPQASLFGQVMFLASLGVSALYNAWLSSLDKEKIHRKLLFDRVLENPKMTKYTLGTRTSAVVFMLLVLQSPDPTALLNELLPNDTKVWKQWKTTILEWLRRPNDQSFQLAGKDLSGFTQQEKDLLGVLFEDARSAYNGYRDYLRVESL